MGELHEILWSLCRRLPSDFAPYGERDRDTADPCADCSCGCRHYVPLSGELGADWGVCANANSPRAGLLTFEHQGCPHFESETGRAGADAPAPPTVAPTDPPDAPRKLEIDFEELLLAVDGSGGELGNSMDNYLDTKTGEIIQLNDNFEDVAELRERIAAGPDDRYQVIESLESRDQFRIMEEFAGTRPDSRLQARLHQALSRNRPFRSFKDAVNSDLDLRARWFEFHHDALARHAREWLEALGITVKPSPPPPA